jgi:two-component system, OmpR family, response regulator
MDPSRISLEGIWRAVARKLLVVEDDPTLRTLLGNSLGENGYTVVVVGDGPSMGEAMALQSFDLIILDLMPRGGGKTVLSFAAPSGPTPAFPLSCSRPGETSSIASLAWRGADNYLTKPFDPRELLARLKSVARRAVENARGGSTLLPLAFCPLDPGSGSASSCGQGRRGEPPSPLEIPSVAGTG